MEPRQLWERHAVVAEAFCRSDERVRAAQSILDQSTADRSRMLAAFSVTVGSDGAVAEMLGLNEREVRVARRTVGKEDARAVADELLAQAAQAAQAAEQQPAAPTEQPYEEPVDPMAGTMPLQADLPPVGTGMAPVPGTPPVVVPPVPPPPVGVPMGTPMPEAEISWSPTLDAVLVSAWQAQVDLSVLAAELGVDLPRLTARAQQLSAEGRLAPARPTGDQAGRHRRRSVSSGHIPSQPAGEPAQTPPAGPMDTGTAWQQWHWQTHTAPEWSTTLPSHDWDGILTQWQTNPQHPAAQPHPSASWSVSSL